MNTTTAPISSTFVMLVPCKAQDFFVRVVSKGQKYGLNNCLTHDSNDHLVEFYAAKSADADSPFGQFISRYYFSTILDRQNGYGLALWSDIPEWSLTASEMDYIKATLGYQVSRYCDSTFDQA
jgi:hypothetical protein